jgi:hypothetical protein
MRTERHHWRDMVYRVLALPIEACFIVAAVVAIVDSWKHPNRVRGNFERVIQRTSLIGTPPEEAERRQRHTNPVAFLFSIIVVLIVEMQIERVRSEVISDALTVGLLLTGGVWIAVGRCSRPRWAVPLDLREEDQESRPR